MDTNADEIKGRAKQAAGDLLGNDEMKRDGRNDERAGKAKKAVNDVKEDVEDAIDAVRDRADRNT